MNNLDFQNFKNILFKGSYFIFSLSDTRIFFFNALNFKTLFASLKIYKKSFFLRLVLAFYLMAFHKKKKILSTTRLAFLLKKEIPGIDNFSLYFPPDRKKVIIQLQQNGKVTGYCKLAINKTGNKLIENEISFYKSDFNDEFLSILRNGKILNKNYFIIRPLDLKNKVYKFNEISNYLEKFKKDTSYILKAHPRLDEIKNQVYCSKNESYINGFNKVINQNTKTYCLALEHGDFNRTNIFSYKNNLIAIDYEYYLANGIELFDFYKYVFFEYAYVKKLHPTLIVKKSLKHVSKEDFELFYLFLLKETLTRINFNHNSKIERESLNYFYEKLIK